jgi:flagellar M-ring protein FliF
MADGGQVVAAGAGGAGNRALAVAAQTKKALQAMPAGRRNWLIGAVALLVAVAAGMMWYAGRTDWRVLFSGLEGKDIGQVSQELGAAGIAFQPTADGTGIEVPAELLDKARMEVAAKGMPQTGRLGFELFDKPNWVGSEFDEKVNYQRALEGELEHTIGTLELVRSARVHLVLPKETLFAGEEKVAKASVVLKLRRAALSAEQTESIRNLVAGAVENLSPAQVTLVDADGRENLNGRGQGAGEADAEQAMENKLVAMLEPLAGAGNVRAVVKVSYDQASEERTDEVYDPALVVPVNVQKSEQSSVAAGRASGVPGTASNTPAAAPQGAVQGSATAAAPGTPPLLQPQGKDGLPVYPQAGGQTQSVKQESAGYAVTKHTVHSEAAPGRLMRVSAAVVVNDRETTEGAGKLEHGVWKPRTPEEMHRLEMLAQAAVGFDAKRGDQVVMQNVSFSSNVPEVKTAGLDRVLEQAKSVAGQPGMLKSGMTGLIGLVLVWFVLKPVATQVVRSLKEPALIAASQTTVKTLGTTSSAVELGESERAALGDGPAADWMNGKGGPRRVAETRSGVFDQVAEHIRRAPAQSTRLLENWIGQEGEDA